MITPVFHASALPFFKRNSVGWSRCFSWQISEQHRPATFRGIRPNVPRSERIDWRFARISGRLPWFFEKCHFDVFASFSMYLAWVFEFGRYHAIDLVESFLLVYFSSQTERFSPHLGQLKVSCGDLPTAASSSPAASTFPWLRRPPPAASTSPRLRRPPPAASTSPWLRRLPRLRRLPIILQLFASLQLSCSVGPSLYHPTL